MGKGIAGLLMGIALMSSSVARGDEAAPASADPVLEKRMMDMAEELRCVVCQSQNLASSHAPLAEDLRNQIRDKLRAGESEDQIRGYLVARYGDYILYRPPFKTTTLLLWLGPSLLLVGGATILVLNSRRRAQAPEEADGPITPEEARRLASLLAKDSTAPLSGPPATGQPS